MMMAMKRSFSILPSYLCRIALMGRQPDSPLRVAVLGAGASGLSAAYSLVARSNNVECDIYELRDRPGGVVTSVKDGGFLYETGPNSMNAKHPEVYNLIHNDLRLSSRVRKRSPMTKNYFIVHDGALQPVPQSLPALVASPLLTPLGKLRILLEPFVPRLKNRVAAEHETVAHFFERRFGKQVAERIIDPFVAGVYSGHPRSLAMKHAFNRLWVLERTSGSIFSGMLSAAFSKLTSGSKPKQISTKELQASFSFDDGLQVLTDSLAVELKNSSRVHFKLNQKITSLDKHERTGLWRVNSRRHRYDAVISTLPAHAVDQVRCNDEEVSRVFKEMKHRIPYAPVAVVVLGYKKEAIRHKLDGFGFLVPSRENRNGLLGVSFSSSLYPERAGRKGEVLLTAYVGGSRFPEKALMPGNRVIGLVSQEIQSLLNNRKVAPSFRRIKVWSQGIPQYDSLTYESAKVEMRIAEEGAPGFILAGNYRDGVGLPDALLSGINAADRALTYCTSPNRAIAAK